jgi:hypothetical protein
LEVVEALQVLMGMALPARMVMRLIAVQEAKGIMVLEEQGVLVVQLTVQVTQVTQVLRWVVVRGLQEGEEVRGARLMPLLRAQCLVVARVRVEVQPQAGLTPVMVG